MGLKSRLTAAVLGLIITGASTFGIAFQFLMEKEGMRLKAYQDGRGIWTICLGHTLGVKPGDTATMEQCLKWAEEEIGPAISRTTELSPVALSPAATGDRLVLFLQPGRNQMPLDRGQGYREAAAD